MDGKYLGLANSDSFHSQDSPCSIHSSRRYCWVLRSICIQFFWGDLSNVNNISFYIFNTPHDIIPHIKHTNVHPKKKKTTKPPLPSHPAPIFSTKGEGRNFLVPCFSRLIRGPMILRTEVPMPWRSMSSKSSLSLRCCGASVKCCCNFTSRSESTSPDRPNTEEKKPWKPGKTQRPFFARCWSTYICTLKVGKTQKDL